MKTETVAIKKAGMQKTGGLIALIGYSHLFFNFWEGFSHSTQAFSNYTQAFSNYAQAFSNNSLTPEYYFPSSNTKSNLKIYINQQI